MILKNLLESIPLQRLVIYLMLLGLIPLGYIAYDYNKKHKELVLLSTKIEEVKHVNTLKKQKQSTNTIVRKTYQDADHFYIDHKLETLVLLEKEKTLLEKMASQTAFSGNELLRSRLNFIKGTSNRLHFTESPIQTHDGVQETLQTLSHSVEIDEENLKTILALIEEKNESQPQLIITDFKLSKKKSPLQSEVYDLSLKVLKREFLNS